MRRDLYVRALYKCPVYVCMYVSLCFQLGHFKVLLYVYKIRNDQAPGWKID